MSYFCFDLDGTLRLIEHRRHLVADGANKWDEFFLSCDKDEPNWDVITIFADLVNAGHRVEIWSGASEISYDMTVEWLNEHVLPRLSLIPDPFDPSSKTHRNMEDYLVNMRQVDDYTPDDILKRQWLEAEDETPDMIFDDRQKVVDMWREEGITCAQIAPGDFDKPKINPPRKAKLTMMIGPSGAGKSTIIRNELIDDNVFYINSDMIRRNQFPADNPNEKWCHQDAYTPRGFKTTFGSIASIVKAHLEGGLDVIYDATNIRRKNRVDFLKNVGADTGLYDVEYIIVDRPITEKLNSYRRTPDVLNRTSEDIIRKHHQTFQSSKKHSLNGDGFDFIKVTDRREFYN